MRTDKCKSLNYIVKESPTPKETMAPDFFILSGVDSEGKPFSVKVRDDFKSNAVVTDFSLDLLLKSGINPSKLQPHTSLAMGFEGETVVAKFIDDIVASADVQTNVE